MRHVKIRWLADPASVKRGWYVWFAEAMMTTMVGAAALLLASPSESATALQRARGPGPVRIMPFGDSITVFDCRLNAYTSADDRPVFQALDTLPAFSCAPT